MRGRRLGRHLPAGLGAGAGRARVVAAPDVGAPGDAAALAATRPAALGDAGHGADPLPGAADLAVAALALAGADVGVLLDDGADTLPDALALGQRVAAAQDVVAQVGQEEEGVLVAGVRVAAVRQLLLAGEELEDLVDEGGDLGRGGDVRAVPRAAVEGCEERARYSANMESISGEPEADGSAERAGERKASERGAR